MARLALGVAGAVIGSFVPGVGTAIGFAIGSAIGGVLFAPDQPDVEQSGPQIGDVSIQSSQYGLHIPKYYGVGRGAGNMIWKAPTEKITHVDKQEGGKGGGGGSVTTTTFTYYASFAIGLAEGPITGVSRVWKDGDLILDFSDNADVASIIASSELFDNFVVYTGSETQEPDPVIESHEGAGNAPAYRGLAYVVFERFSITAPAMNLSFEIVDEGNRSYIIDVITNPVVSELGVSFDMHGLLQDSIQYIDTSVSSGTTQLTSDRITIDFAGDILSKDTVTINGNNSPVVLNGCIRGSDDFIYLHTNFPTAGSGLFQFVAEKATELDEYNSFQSPLSDVDGSRLDIDFQHGIVRNNKLYAISQGADINNLFMWDYPYFGFAEAKSVFPDEVTFVDVNDNGVYAISTSGAPDFDVTLRKFDFDLVQLNEWIMVLDNMSGPYINAANELQVIVCDLNGTRFNILELQPDNTSTIIHTETLTLGGGFPVPVGNMMLFGDTWIGGNLGSSGRLVSDIVTDRCTRAGLVPADIDVTDITDTCDGYVVSRKSLSARQSLEPLMISYLFDAVESDWTLKFKTRGQASLVTIPKDDLGAHVVDTDRPDNIVKTIAQEVELPKQINIGYINKDFDYQKGTENTKRISVNSSVEASIDLPIVFTKDDAKQLSEIIIYNRWLERTRYDIAVGFKYAYLEPTDVITVEVDNFIGDMRIDGMTIGDLITMRCVAERPGVYTSTAVGEGVGSGQTSVAFSGNTRCELMNLPSLRQQDSSSAGYYIAMYGVYTQWSGGVLFESSNASTWNEVIKIFGSSTAGTATNSLSAGPEYSWDDVSVLNVAVNDVLSTVVESDVLSGENIAAYGSTGRWEIIQFANAVLQGDGTYDLSRLLRGRSGSYWAASMHAANDKFVLLSTTTTRVSSIADALINSSFYFKCPSFNQTLESAPQFQFTRTAENLQPFAPHHLRTSRSGLDLVVDWIRRDRVSPQTLWEPPLSESTESYDVEFYDDTFTTLYRTTTVDAATTTTYTFAEQTSDGVSPGSSIGVRCYQNSSVVTRVRFAQTTEGSTVAESLYHDIILANGPVSYWQMHEASGNLTAEGTTAIVLSPNGSPTYSQPGPLSGGQTTASIFFDGIDDYFVGSVLPLGQGHLSAYTIEYFVYLTSALSNNGNICAQGRAAVEGDLNFYVFVLSSGGLSQRAVPFTGSLLDSVSTMSTGAWYHIAHVYEESHPTQKSRLYIDGALDASSSSVLTFTGASNQDDLLVGSRPNSVASTYFKGRLSQLAVYNRALSDAEVLADYNAS